MKSFHLFGLAVALTAAAPLAPARAQGAPLDYRDYVVAKLDVCPHLRLTTFDFRGSEAGSVRTYFYSWRNTEKKAITAFEVRTLRFNPFNEQLLSFATTIPGHGSRNYSPLQAGEEDQYSIKEDNDAELFTALAYVSKIRFVDGTIWRVNPAAVYVKIKAAAPTLAGVSLTGPTKETPKAPRK